MTSFLKYSCFSASIIFSIIMLSCSASKYDNDLPAIPSGQLKDVINSGSDFITTLEGSGTIAFDSPEMTSSGFFEIKIKKPDSIHIKIEGPFGIDIASALITRYDFIYYNAQENKVITGPSTEINIGAILKFKVTFDELLNSFCYSFNFGKTQEDTLDAPVEENFYILSSTHNERKSKYYINPSNYKISKVKVFDALDKILLEILYSDITCLSKVCHSDKFIIKRPEQEQTVWLYFESKELNKQNITFRMKYPKSAKVIKWE